MRVIKRITAYFLVLIMTLTHVQGVGALSVELLTQISEDEHSLIQLPEETLEDAVDITIDASEVGGSDQLKMAPELGEVSLKSRHDIEPGIYKLPIEITKENGEVETTEYNVQVRESDLERSWDEEIIYFLLTDRFYDGDTSNNNPFDMPYEEAENQGGVYQGGDFLGVAEQLDYLDDLGITTIWISPIVMNVQHNVEMNSTNPEYYAYHGYWALDFEELNPHFGSLEDFHYLIDEAASRDIHIMVDVVLNHVGYGLHPQDEGENIPGFPTDEDRDQFDDMIRQEPGNDDITMSLSGLPDLITEDPDVSEQVIQWQTDWIEFSQTEAGNAIKSFRVDTANHVDKVTLQAFKNAIVEIDPEFNLIAESWGADFRNPKGFLNSGMMDSVLDFSFKEDAAQFANGQLERVSHKFIDRNEKLQSNATVGSFLSSHDEVGFLYKLHNNQGKGMIAASLQMTAKGQPVIYYGEEIGQTGANNWPYYDNRRFFQWEEIEDNKMLEHYRALIQFRREFSKVLARGNRQTIAGSNEEGWIAIHREYEEESVYVVFNLNEEPVQVTLPVESDSPLNNYYNSDQVEVIDGIATVEVPSIEDGGTALIGAE